MASVTEILDEFLTALQSDFVHLEVSNVSVRLFTQSISNHCHVLRTQVAKQFLNQVFRFIDALLFNVLLLRKDLCSFQRCLPSFLFCSTNSSYIKSSLTYYSSGPRRFTRICAH